MSYHPRAVVIILLTASCVQAQSAGHVGTLEGSVRDPSGAPLAHAEIELARAFTAFRLTAQTDAAGTFRLLQLPLHDYRLTVRAGGFATQQRTVEVRSAVPIRLALELTLTPMRNTVDVEALVENTPSAHTVLNRDAMAKLPAQSPASGLSDVLMLAAPGVVADSNGFFHPLGDHAQTSFLVDGQPINDQQSKAFSTQLPLQAIESVEAVTSAPNAEFGDKTSLVVVATTRSALGASRPFGSLDSQYGSFGSPGLEATLGAGTRRLGNFLALSGTRTGRFLDTPEFRPYHAVGNAQTIFNRFDFQPNTRHSLHLKALALRNWFQVPNTLDQPQQDQRQKATTFNLGLGWTFVPSANTLMAASAFLRRDQVNLYPSPDAMQDTPITLGQQRGLTNSGGRTDVSLVRGRHNLKLGGQAIETRLNEQFFLGVTDRDFAALAAFPPGGVFRFQGRGNIHQAAAYAQDQLRWGHLNISAGLRFDEYRGIARARGWQPRLGLSYRLKPTGTVLRAAYSRTFETPYNENLLLASTRDAVALKVFGAEGVQPIQPGRRHQFNAGFQQSLSRWMMAEGDYFWKYTRNAYDFGALLTTPLVFPISWDQSKLAGFSLRLASRDIRGFQAYTTIAHTSARFFGPLNGGLVFTGDRDAGAFRIDHDQAFQSTTHVRYQPRREGWYTAYTWRFDSGLVSGDIGSYGDALALTPAQQAAMGLYCGPVLATPARGLTSCADNQAQGALRYRIPYPEAQADHHPPRVAPRHLQNLTIGTDNLWRNERVKTTLRLSVTNLLNRQALYNFLSPFGGTHFVAPRMWQAQLGWRF